MKKKYIKPLMALVLVGAMTVGGTLAYLTDTTKTVTNTFTSGTGISITLDESQWTTDENGAYYLKTDTRVISNTYTLTSTTEYPKDPVVTVGSTSASCYLFVDVIEFYPSSYDSDLTSGDNVPETYTFADFINYSVLAYDSTGDGTAGWKQVTGTSSFSETGSDTYLEDDDITTKTTTTTYVWVDTDGKPLSMSADSKKYILADMTSTTTDDGTANGSIVIGTINATKNNLADSIDGVSLSFVAYALETASVTSDKAEEVFLSSFELVTEP